MHGKLCRNSEQQMANLECNAVCGVAITHHFLAKMVCAFLRTSLRTMHGPSHAAISHPCLLGAILLSQVVECESAVTRAGQQQAASVTLSLTDGMGAEIEHVLTGAEEAAGLHSLHIQCRGCHSLALHSTLCGH